MKMRISSLLATLSLMPFVLWGQVIIQPYAGHLFGEMENANSVVKASINQASELLGEEIQSPGKFDGGQMYGLQLTYNTHSDLFININVGYHSQKLGTSQVSVLEPGSWEYRFERKVELYDVTLNLQHFLNYSSWRRLNYYLGLGAGWMMLQADSYTYSTASMLPLDSRGSFNRSIFSGNLAAGMRFRLAGLLFLWGEGGLQYGNFGKLEGTVTTLEEPRPVPDQTETEFDLTGFFVRGGIGFVLPFLR